MTLSIVQILIFVSYISFIILKFGILPSISESWYRLRELGGVWSSLFTWFCWGLGFIILFQTNGNSPLFFLSGVGLSSVGVATMFKLKDDIQSYIHSIGATIGIICALIGIGIERYIWLPLIDFVILAIIFYIFVDKNKIWWIEIIAFLSIGLGLLFTS
jgi:hypothetical protein